MLVSGGLDPDGNTIKDCFILSLITWKWSNMSNHITGKIPGVSNHACVSINKCSYSKDNYPKIPIDAVGIWIFGGRNKNGQATSKLWLIKTNDKLRVIRKTLKGVLPKGNFFY